MKKKLFLILFSLLLTLIHVMAQESVLSNDSIKHHVSIGINWGPGLNINGFKQGTDETTGFTYYGVNPNYSLGFDLGFRLSKKSILRFEYQYVKMQYGMHWGDNYPTFDKTIASLKETQFNVHFDYLTFSNKKMQIFISPGILYEFVMKKSFENTMADGDVNDKNYSVLDEQYPKDIMGGNISAIIKYKLNDHFRITLTPGYTCFFHKFLESNNKLYQRLNLNLGLEFSVF